MNVMKFGRPVALLALFASVAVGFSLYRASDIYVWNDSPAIGDRPLVDFAADRAELARDPVGCLAVMPRESFVQIGGGYRPLSSLQKRLSLYGVSENGPLPCQRLLYGGVYGLFAVCVFLTARRFTRYGASALLAVALVLGCPPLVSSSWLVIAGLQVAVPLLICVALLLYWQFTEATRARYVYLAALCVVLLVGPWFREFTGVSPLLIVLCELRRARRPTPLVALMGIFFLHAVFPTALVKWLWIPELPLLPVTKLGNLGGSLGRHGFHWWMALEFLPLLPPILLLLTVPACVRTLGRMVPAPLTLAWLDRKAGIEGLTRYVVTAVLAVATVVLWHRSRLLADPKHQEQLGVALCLGIAVAGLRFDWFLAAWFLVTFIPLLRVAVETVHFLYPLVPAAIIVACAAESAWCWGVARRGRLAWLRYAVAIVIATGTLDQLLVIYGGYRVMHGQQDGVRAVAAKLREQVPAGSIVISNVIHGIEIEWAAQGHYRTYWTVPWGIHFPDRILRTGEELERLLVENHGKTKVYFLDCDFDYLPNKMAHRHQFVHSFETGKRALGTLHVTSARYPFADPLRHLTRRPDIPFLGPPDLVNDFYYGRAVDGRWFTNELRAEYRLYDVTDTYARFKDPKPVVVEQLDAFSVVLCDGCYFGVRLSGDAFDLGKARGHRYSPCFEGSKVAAVRRKIGEFLASQTATGRQTRPELVR